MPIEFNNNIFHIYNDSISYCIELSKYKDLLHIYYGKRIDSNNIYILKRDRASFSAYEGKDYKYSLDVLPQEYPMFGAQDMRSPALEFEYEDGRYDMCNMRYKSHKIIQGKRFYNEILDGWLNSGFKNKNRFISPLVKCL